MSTSEQTGAQLMPRRRLSDLTVRDVDDECLVHDGADDTVTLLDPVTAVVWRRCDGVTSRDLVAEDLGIDDDTLVVALGRAAEAGLLDTDSVTRRMLLTSAATVGALASLVTIAAPAAAAAASGPVVGTVTLTRLSCVRAATVANGSTISIRVALRNWAPATQYRVTLSFPTPAAPTNPTAGSTTITVTTNGAGQFTTTTAVTVKVPRSTVRATSPIRVQVAPTSTLVTLLDLNPASTFASC